MDSATLQIIIAAKDQASTALKVIDEQLGLIGATAKEAAASVDASLGTMDASIAATSNATTAAAAKAKAAVTETAAASDAMASNTAAKLAIMDAATAKSSAEMNKMVKTASLVGIAVAGYIGYQAVKSAGDLQVQLTKLSTTAGESQSNLQMVGDGLLKMSVDTGTGVKQLADAMYIVESAGNHGAAGLMILKAAAQGAKAENADLTNVADAVTSVLRDYNLPATKAAEVTSKLVAAVGAGKANFNDFTGALHSILPLAASAHVSLDDIAGSMASMTVHGTTAQQAAENMADAIRHLQSPTQPMITELAQLGLTSNDVSDSLSKRGLSGTMEMLSTTILNQMGPSGKLLLNVLNQSKDAARDANDMIKAMPPSLQNLAKEFQGGKISVADYRAALKALPTDQAQLMQQFVSLENRAKGFSNAIKAGGPDAQTYASALQKATGDASSLNVALQLTGENSNYTAYAINAVSKATTEAGNNVKGWSEIQGNMNFKMQQAKEAVSATSTAMGTALLPAVTAFLSAIDKVLIPIATWAENHRKLASTIILVGGALAGAVTGLIIYDKLVRGVKESETVMAVGRGIVAAATWAWAAAQGALTAATVAFDAVLDAMGIGELLLIISLILAAIIALVLAIKNLITHWKEVGEKIKEAADKVKDAWQPVADFFKRLWGDIERVFQDGIWFISDLWHHPLDAIKLFGQKVGDLFDRIVGDFKSYGKKMLDNIVTGFSNSVTNAKQIGKDLVKNIRKGWDEAVDQVGDWFGGTWTKIKNKAPQWGRDIADGIKKGLMALVNYDINSVLNWVNSASKAVTSAIQFGSKIVKNIKNGFEQGVKDVKNWGADIINGVKNGIEGAVKDLPGEGKRIITGIVNGMKNAVTDIVDFFKDLPKNIEKDLHGSGDDVAEKHVKGLSDHWKDAGKMKKLGEDILKGIGIAILAIVGGILLVGVSIAIALVNGIISGIKNAGKMIGDGVSWIINEVGKHWDGIKSVIEAPFKVSFNAIARMWNDTVGKLHFKAPSWVPGIGGKGWDMPNLPYLQAGTPWFAGGSVIVGENGPEVVNLPQGSSVYSNANSQGKMGQSMFGNVTIQINSQAFTGSRGDARKFATDMWQEFQQIARQHGNAKALPNIGVLPN